MKSVAKSAASSFALVASLATGGLAFGAVAESDNASNAQNDSQTYFDNYITATDLINQGTATFSNTVGSGTYSTGGNGGSGFDKLNDGIASSKGMSGINDLSGDTYFASGDLNSGPSATFYLNTSANASGYDLTGIKTINGWADTQTFSDQHYTVSYRVIGAASFTPLYTVNYSPFSNDGSGNTQNSSLVSLAPANGSTTLAHYIDAVRFTYGLNTNVSGQAGQVVREIEVNGAPSTGTPPPPPPPVPTILPLGDSITYGDQGNPGPVPGGYRTQLYNHLTNDGYSFNYLGSQTSNASATLSQAGQVNNEGHNGYRIDQITNNLDGSDGTGGNNGGYWLAGGNGTGRPAIFPNHILLHIGTNDILQHYDPSYSGTAPEQTFLTDLESRMTSLISRLVSDRPLSNLFVASIIPLPNITNGNGVADNTEVMAYDAWIKGTLVPEFQAMNDKVFFVDQYANFVNGDGSIKTALLPDNIHPNQQGYDMMGDTWAQAVEGVPEPTSLAALGLAAVGLLARRRGRA